MASGKFMQKSEGVLPLLFKLQAQNSTIIQEKCVVYVCKPEWGKVKVSVFSYNRVLIIENQSKINKADKQVSKVKGATLCL